VRRREELEIPEVRAQDDDPPAGITTLDLLPVREALIGYTLDKPAMEKPGQADILSPAPAKVDIRGAQDTTALALTAIWKCDCQVPHPNPNGATTEKDPEIPRHHAYRIQQKARQKAEHGQQPHHQVKPRRAYAMEPQTGKSRTIARGDSRSVRLLPRAGVCRLGAPMPGGSLREVRSCRRAAGWRSHREWFHNVRRSRLGAFGITTSPE